MALFSPALPITFRGEPATLAVVHNDAECWGRIVMADGRQFDVSGDDDLYDLPVSEAMDALVEAAHDEDNVSEAQGWL